jgi:hypothetical protein
VADAEVRLEEARSAAASAAERQAVVDEHLRDLDGRVTAAEQAIDHVRETMEGRLAPAAATARSPRAAARRRPAKPAALDDVPEIELEPPEGEAPAEEREIQEFSYEASRRDEGPGLGVILAVVAALAALTLLFQLLGSG